MARPKYPEGPTCHLPGLDSAERRCWDQFLGSSTALFATLNARLVDTHKLTLLDVLLLDLLTKSDGGFARMSGLADTFMLTPGRTTQQIARLESRGLVRRIPSPNDRRGVLAGITPAGRARLAPALETYAREIRTQYLDQMPRQRMIALGDACRRISPPPTATDGPRG